MVQPPKISRRISRVSARRGVALVIVLGLVVLLSLLIVGLLLKSESEQKITSRQFHALEARLAADSALQIVEGQLRQATTMGIDASGQGAFTWASQPGAVRVYDDSGTEKKIFKLYSSAEMIVPGDTSLAADMPAGWPGTRTYDPDEFVDVNEPVRRGDDWIYPIASPDALGTVVGFSSSLTDTGGADGPDNRLVMPVRWLYLLDDGTTRTKATLASDDDPIVRFAFWTDDESSKINLNTASATDAASYWDIPRATYHDDLLLARRQPVENEFNRYPGHPATVSLQTVFTDQTIADIIKSTPRYEWGGSQNGTLDVTVSGTLPNAKHDRLYATPDEYLFSQDRTVQLDLNAPELDAKRFFLTTASRSSDLNLFGQPRVTIWPISGIDDNNHRTIYDRTIAFNSTLGPEAGPNKPYYFLRSDPNSQTADWDLYERNQEIFTYLQGLTSRDIPGFGGDFETKYGVGERDQILTEIFDYIRTVNLNETYAARGSGFVSYTNDRVSGNDGTLAAFNAARGAGWVLPIKTPFGRGAGRVPVISEIGLWLIQTQDVTKEGTPTTYADAEYADPDPQEVQVGLIIGTFSPMQGIMQWVPLNFSYRVQNITAPTINGQPIFPNGETESSFLPPGSSYSRSQDLGGTDGFAWSMSGGLSTGIPNHIGEDPILHIGENPFLMSKPDAIPLPSDPPPPLPPVTTLGITPGEIKISFMTSPDAGTKGQGTVFQTYSVRIPDAILPIPTPVRPMRYGDPDYDLTVRNGWYQRKPDGTSVPLFFPQDVVRGLAVKHGDYRTEAYLQDVPASFFQDELQSEYGFRTRQNTAYRGTKNGSYVPGLSYPPEDNSANFTTARPKIPKAIDDLVAKYGDGDFDNGLANNVDGPFLNKSDEGALPADLGREPYFFARSSLADGLFSPFRQVPSAVVFGSLPTGVWHTKNGTPTLWRTLAFSPNPPSGSSHYGLSAPPDHLLLDLFTMPIVEPYAISEPFSTAGRLNMNYQIAPFSHITRQTALYAALASQKIIAIADADAATYKTSSSGSYPDRKIRFPVDAAETLKAFDDYLTAENQNLFRSASEICGIDLVPEGPGNPTAASVPAWWDDYRLTGNNSREKPYSSLYPLLTTKSNVFTVHIRAQSIKRTPSGKIAVQGEYRGSVLFERYLDPKNPIFEAGPDNVNPDVKSLEPYFQFRTLSAKQFDP